MRNVFNPYKKPPKNDWRDWRYWEGEYAKYLEKNTRKARDIEKILDDHNFFKSEDEGHLRGIVHTCICNLYKIKENDIRVLHIANLIKSVLPSDGVTAIMEKLWDCNCDVCISLLRPEQRIDALLRRIGKKPRSWRRQELTILLDSEKITEERVKHCVETPIYEGLWDGDKRMCGCPLHKGRFQSEFVYYLKTNGAFTDRYSTIFWIRVRRKDQVLNTLRKDIIYGWRDAKTGEVFTKKEVGKDLRIQEFVRFSDHEVVRLRDIRYGIERLRDEFYDSELSATRKRCEENIRGLEEVKTMLKSKKSKLMRIQTTIELIKEEMQAMESSPEEYPWDRFQGIVFFDIPW